jgi:UDP-glucose 4-epimerase
VHVVDLAELVERQLAAPAALDGGIFNAGGGLANSVSLAEFSDRCAALTGVRLDVGSRTGTRPGDVPIYVSDNAKVQERFGWGPRRSVDDIARDLFVWIESHADVLRAALT